MSQKIKGLKSNADVAHAFATHGNFSDNWGAFGNMFFEDRTIYSYGRHFAIAKFIAKDVLLFVDHTFSNSTTKHIGLVSGATSQYTKLYVNNPSHSLIRNVKRAELDIEANVSLISGSKRGGRQEWYSNVSRNVNHLQGILEYLQSLDGDDQYLIDNMECIPVITNIIETFEGLTKDNKSSAIQEVIARNQQRQLEELENRRTREIEQTNKFLEHKINNFNSEHQIMRIEDGIIHTSLNVKLPIDVVKHAYEKYKRNELESVGDWKVLGNTKTILTIGCHRFKTEYIKEFMKKLQ